MICVGIDVAKDKHDCFILSSEGEILADVFTIQNNAEGFDTLPDLINLSFNLNRYPLIRDISDMGKIGREYLLTVKGCLPADDEDDPKYGEFGRKLIQSG